MKLKRSWFCQCGWTFDEMVMGTNKDLDLEGAEGTSHRYCSGCNSKVEMAWRVIENTDPDDELNEPSDYCTYCKELKSIDEMHYVWENYSHPVCNDCAEKNNSEHDADMDAQDIKWGKDKV